MKQNSQKAKSICHKAAEGAVTVRKATNVNNGEKDPFLPGRETQNLPIAQAHAVNLYWLTSEITLEKFCGWE